MIWQYFSFSDVTKIMKELKFRQVKKQDLNSIDYINKTLDEKDDYPSFEQALSMMRVSPFFSVINYEKKNLFIMFFMHMTDVTISLLSAILAIQILRTFENNIYQFKMIEWFFAHPTTTQKVYFVMILAVSIFCLNVMAASLHAQKIEKEMFLSWKIPIKLLMYGYNHLLNISRNSRVKFQSGDINNIFQNDARFLADFFSHAFVDFPVLIVSTLLVVFIMHLMIGNIAWLGFAIVCLQVPISLFISWLGNIFHRELMIRSDKRIRLISEWVQGMRLIRYFGWGHHFQSEINKSAKSEFIQSFKITTKYSVGFALTMTWWMLVSAAIFAGILYFHGQKEASTIFSAIWLSAILGNQITPLPWFVNIFSQSIVGSGRLKQFFQAKGQSEEFISENDVSLTLEQTEFIAKLLESNDHVECDVSFFFEDVWLKFSENEPWVLSELSFELEANKTTAIIGHVGSGKSLIIQILMGEIPPTKGKVYLCLSSSKLSAPFRLNINSMLGLKVLRKIQSFVPQEAFIFSATIAENVPISYNSSFSTRERNDIMNALYAASMGRDVEQFDGNLDAEIGEKGVNLSGGQRQRLNLSRSAFVDSAVIFLDDPFSALDSKTEEELVESLFSENWGKEKTIVWSTHRLSFIYKADVVIVIEEGGVVEKGSYKSLSENVESRLYKLIEGLL